MSTSMNLLKKLTCCVAAALLLMLPAAPKAACAAALTSADGAVAEVTAPDGTTTYYATLPEAVAAAPDNSTVSLLSDTTLTVDSTSGTTIVLTINKPLTLDGNGHTVTLDGHGIAVWGGESATEADRFDATIRDITLTNAAANGRIIWVGRGVGTLTCDDVVMETTGSGNTQVLTMGDDVPYTTTINLNACTLNASEAGYGIITFNPVNLNLAATDVSGYGAIYLKGADSSTGSSGSVVNITNGSTVTSTGIPGPSNSFGTIIFEGCDNVKVNVEDSTVSAKAPDGEPATLQYAIMFSGYESSDGNVAHDNAITFGEGSNVRTIGKNSVFVATSAQPNEVNATAGTYELQGYTLATDGSDPGTDIKVTGGTWNTDMSEFVPEGFASTQSEEDGPFTVAETESQGKTPDPTQVATPSGTTAESAAEATGVATPSGSALADDATQQVSDSAARAGVQQTGDAESAVIAIAVALAAAGGLALLLRRRFS